MDVFPIRKVDSFRDCYIICLDRTISEAKFIRRAGVKENSYAGNLMASIYRQIMSRSIDMKYDFEKYFELEYKYFVNYLKYRCFMHDNEIERVNALYEESSKIIMYDPFHSFISEEYGVGFLKKMMATEDD